MSKIHYRLAVLTPVKAQAFAKLAQVVIDAHGWRLASQKLGVSIGTLERLVRDHYLTDKMAPVVLRGWKAYKAQQVAA